MESLTKVNETLKSPHTIHLHANNLGHPGNKDASFHLTHCQFNAYGRKNWGDFESGAPDISEYLNSHKNVTIDIGQVIFAKAATTTMTADAPWEFALHHLGGASAWGAKPGMKWFNGQVEGESGSGIDPYFINPKVAVNAIQWAIGLELMLLTKNPWQVLKIFFY